MRKPETEGGGSTGLAAGVGGGVQFPHTLRHVRRKRKKPGGGVGTWALKAKTQGNLLLGTNNPRQEFARTQQPLNRNYN